MKTKQDLQNDLDEELRKLKALMKREIEVKNEGGERR